MQYVITEYKAEEFLEEEGFPIVKRELFSDYKKAFKFAKEIGFPVVLKIASDKLLHKSDVNAVKLNVTEENFISKYKELEKIKIEKFGIIVQEYINGKYVLIGIKKDLTFGHVLVAGIGGIFAEIIKDVSFRVLPVNKKEAVKMLKELKAYKVLEGYRGEKVNIDDIVKVIVKVSELSEKYPNIAELDLNPLIVNSNNSKIVDARIIFE